MISTAMPFFPLAWDRLTRIGRPIKKFLSFSLTDETIAPGECLSVHVERGGISVAHGARFLSRLTIKGAKHYPFEAGKYPPPEVVAASVHLAVNDFRAGEADVTLIIPKAWAIMKKADFPLVAKQSLVNVMSYELDRLTPFSSERAYYDYRVIGEEGGRLQVILAALKAETLDPYLSALAQKGITVKRVIVSLSALGALSHHIHGGETTAFLDIHRTGYEGGFIDGGSLQTAFAGTFSSDAEAEKAGAIAAALNPLLDVFKKGGKAPTVFINSKTGPSPLLPENIHAPVRFLSSMDLKPRFLNQTGVSLHTVTGGILESLLAKFRGLNLLDKGIHKRERTPMALTVLLLMGLAGVGLFAMAASLQIETKKAEAIEREIAIRGAEVKEIEALHKDRAALEKEINAVEQFKTTKPMVLNLFKELTLVLPQDAWLARVHLTDATLNIEGYTASATDLLRKLEASRYFKKVEFASPTFRDVRMKADRFVIKMEIEDIAEGQVKNEKK